MKRIEEEVATMCDRMEAISDEASRLEGVVHAQVAEVQGACPPRSRSWTAGLRRCRSFWRRFHTTSRSSSGSQGRRGARSSAAGDSRARGQGQGGIR
jgi:hypothetical protein